MKCFRGDFHRGKHLVRPWPQNVSENILWVQLSSHKVFSWDLGYHKKFRAKNTFCGVLLVILHFGFAMKHFVGAIAATNCVLTSFLWVIFRITTLGLVEKYCGPFFKIPQIGVLCALKIEGQSGYKK